MTFKGEITSKNIVLVRQFVNIDAEDPEEAYMKLESGDYFVMDEEYIDDLGYADDDSVAYEIVDVEE